MSEMSCLTLVSNSKITLYSPCVHLIQENKTHHLFRREVITPLLLRFQSLCLRGEGMAERQSAGKTHIMNYCREMSAAVMTLKVSGVKNDYKSRGNIPTSSNYKLKWRFTYTCELEAL